MDNYGYIIQFLFQSSLKPVIYVKNFFLRTRSYLFERQKSLNINSIGAFYGEKILCVKLVFVMMSQ